jgi:hypothetical protein
LDVITEYVAVIKKREREREGRGRKRKRKSTGHFPISSTMQKKKELAKKQSHTSKLSTITGL